MSNRRRMTLPAWFTARRIRWIDAVSLVFGTAVVSGRFFELHALLAPAEAPSLGVLRAAPLQPPPGFGWWSWLDQHFYLQSALAWAQGDLTPALHWYPPGYALLGAVFSHITPADAFVLPDLLCLVGALWLFAAISVHLAGEGLGRSLGVWLFVATIAVPKRVMTAWVVPWTTTPATICLMGCLLATLRLLRKPTRTDAFVAGLAAAATLAFRPADAAVVGGVCAVASAGALLRRWPGTRRASGIVAAALAGAAVPIVVFGAALLAVDGFRPDGYLAGSAVYGFEWRLLPLRWVVLMVDPMPLLIDGQGLAQVFPWIVTGIAGMVVCLVATPASSRLAHTVVVAAVMADVVQFLCYRDLHPDYLWHNNAFHYFKWTLPFFGLYSALLLRALLSGPRAVPAMLAAATMPALFAWRVTLTDSRTLPAPLDRQTLVLPHGLPRLDDVLLARTVLGQTRLIATGSEIHDAERVFRSGADFKLTPWSETLMVQPLRPLPADPGTLVFGDGSYTLDLATAPVLSRATLVWGLPCWVRTQRPVCQSAFLLPAPGLVLGQTVRFGPGRDGEAYRLAGLAASEPGGDWTDGPQASLWFRLPPGRTGPLALDLTAAGFAPTGDPMRVAVYANGVLAGHMAYGREASTGRTLIPAEAIRPDGNIQLDIAVADPRTPMRYAATSDTRALGIRITALRVGPAD